MIAIIVVCLIGLVHLVHYRRTERTRPNQVSMASTDKENIFLFVPAERGGLEKKSLEIRQSLSERAKADILFQELRKARVIPASAKLHQLAFGEGGMLYLNISHDAIEQQLDAKGEVNAVYGLVNSFVASFRDVNRMQLLVDGRPVHTFAGVVYTYAPLRFNDDLQEE